LGFDDGLLGLRLLDRATLDLLLELAVGEGCERVGRRDAGGRGGGGVKVGLGSGGENISRRLSGGGGGGSDGSGDGRLRLGAWDRRRRRRTSRGYIRRRR
jgi:hypothetical protein